MKNEKLWQEILYHSNMLMNQYKAENQTKYDNSNSFYNFVKVECTSTYPRLTFVIKFLPILNGVSLIHVYSQNKLSRFNDTETSISQIKNYKEIDIIYGFEIKNSANIEFRYTEPKKLKEIETFFQEFYLLNHQNKYGMFYNPNLEIKYFDSSLILMVDEIINLYKHSNFEVIISKINNKLYESYMNGGEIDKLKMIENLNNGNASGVLVTGNTAGINGNHELGESALDTSVRRVTNMNNFNNANGNLNTQNAVNTEPGMNINTNFMTITKQFILKEIFLNNNFQVTNSNYKFLLTINSQFDNINYSNLNNTKNDKDNNTLMLSKIDETHLRHNNLEFTENDRSFDFVKQLSEISKMDYNEDENVGLTQQSYYKVHNLNPMINNSGSFDISISEIEKKVINTKINNSEYKEIVNTIPNYKFTAKNSNKKMDTNANNISHNINKLHQSISKVENINKFKSSNQLSFKTSKPQQTPNFRMNYQPKDVLKDFQKLRGKSQDFIQYGNNFADKNEKIEKLNILTYDSKVLDNIKFNNKISLDIKNQANNEIIADKVSEFKPYDTNANEIYFENESDYAPETKFSEKTLNVIYNEREGGGQIESIPINTDLEFKMEEPNVFLSTINANNNQGIKIDPNNEYATFR